jgi:hypothetical protein
MAFVIDWRRNEYGAFKLQVPLSGRYVIAVKLVLKYGGINMAPSEEDKFFISSKTHL